jgi:hypothetical protein
VKAQQFKRFRMGGIQLTLPILLGSSKDFV